MFIALDLETTGLRPNKDRIIEIAAVKIKPDGTIVDEFSSLINPEIPLPDLIKNLTGITDEELQDAPTLEDLREQIVNFFGDEPILGHSVQFDIDFLNANNIQTGETVLDTFQLAQTLLPNEKSYSLEVLSEKFGLTHESKHRALDDTKVAIELYKLLLEKIGNIPTETNSLIRSVLTRSQWGWKELFLTHLNDEKGSPLKKPAEKLPNTKGSPHVQKHLIETLSKGESCLLEASEGEPIDLAIAATTVSEQTGEQCLITTPTPQLIPPDARLAHLQHPVRYLCKTAFQDILKKTSFEDHETRLLTKILIWLTITETGERNEITVGDDERSTWDQISALPHLYKENYCQDPDCFYHRAWKSAKRAPVLVVSHHLLIDNIKKRGTLIPEKPHLLVDSIETFEESALNAFTQHFSAQDFTADAHALGDDELASSFDIFFGFLGIFLEKHADKNAFARQIILDSNLQTTAEWHKMHGALSNLDTKIQSLPESAHQTILASKFNILKKALALTPQALTWMMLNFNGDPVVKACPIEIGQLLHQELWSNHTTLTGLSAFGSLNGSFKFLKNRLVLPDLQETILEPTKNDDRIPVILHPNLPHPRSPRNLQATTDLIENLATEGTSFLIVNALSAIEQLQGRIVNPLKKEEILVLAQGISGGMGKIGQLFEKARDKTLIIGNQRLFEFIMKNNGAPKIETLFIHRLPFLPPSHPVHQHICKQLNDDFNEYSVPQAIFRLKKFLHLFLKYASPKKIHILDPRFEEYDGKFVKALPQTVTIGS